MSETPVVTQQPAVNYIEALDKTKATLPEKLPHGLTQLGQCTEVSVKQHIDSVEVVVCCCARPNRYSVYAGNDDEQCLYIQEVSNCYARQLSGAARGIQLKFSDKDYVDTIRVIRPATCSRGCCVLGCTPPIMKIQTPPGTTIATITEIWSCLCPEYHITNNDGQVMYKIRATCCYSWISSLLCDIHIPIYDADGNNVAELVKKTKMKISECLGQANDFSVKFLTDLTVMQKTTLLSAVFLLDFHYFERQNRCCC